jgi:uncharacterized radical SAM superfamily protein
MITAYRPGGSFPAVSVTGRGCDLMCGHCRGAHLRGMADVRDPAELLRKATEIKQNGGTGMLISGGCDKDGRVPLLSFENEIRTIAAMGLELNVHAGLVNADGAKRLRDAGVSVFSVDVHQDPSVIKGVLNLDRGPEAYRETIDGILSAGGRVVPHVTVGFGTADMMLSAELLRSRKIEDITLLALVPASGTDVHAHIPREAAMSSVRLLRDMGLRVTLGCMRGRDSTLETECIAAGIRRIANPSVRTVRWAEENGFTVKEVRKCCSF